MLPNNPAEQRHLGEWVQPDVMGSLSVPPSTGRSAVPMAGAVLNAINGHNVNLADIPLIAKFLRSLQAGGGPRAVDQIIYQVMQGMTVGRALSSEGQRAIRQAIRDYASGGN